MVASLFSPSCTARRNSASRLLWASNGKNISLSAITYNNSNTCRQFITSSAVDPDTGFNWGTDIQTIMGSLVKPQILMIGQGSVLVNDVNLSSQVDARYDRVIETTNAPGLPSGAQQIRSSVKLRDVAGQNPQASLMLIADGDQAATLRPFDEFYYKFWYFVPSSLDLVIGQTNGNWKTVMELKKGRGNAGGGSGVGDFRFTVVLNGDNGYPEVQTKTDNQANGFAASPPIAGLGVAADPPYWEARGGNMAGIVKNAWHKVEVYFKSSADYTDLTTGRAVVVMTPYVAGVAQTRVVVCNKFGGVMTGIERLPVTRFFLTNTYSSEPVTHTDITTGWELWSTMPYQIV